MEMVAILLSVPAACFASAVYYLILVKVISQRERLRRSIGIASITVLALFALELILLAI